MKHYFINGKINKKQRRKRICRDYIFVMNVGITMQKKKDALLNTEKKIRTIGRAQTFPTKTRKIKKGENNSPSIYFKTLLTYVLHKYIINYVIQKLEVMRC